MVLEDFLNRERATSLGMNSVSAMAFRTWACFSGATRAVPLMTRETVAGETPARRAKDVFGCLERMASDASGLRLLLGGSGGLIQLRGAVRYRYNPTVRYTLELYQHPTDAAGELRVTLRSQSRGLLEEMDRFFRLWTRLEERSFADGSFLSYDLAEGRFSRRLRCAGCSSGEEAGGAIAGYIRLMDAVMQAYFVTLPNGQRAAATAAPERFAGALTDEVAGV